ncbi:MAG: hypothetical protein HQK75_04620 [Candidatus Magnetomorum sp.]|nr:hypothetical protein [Candidatus Magnetomorum sp.]
MQIQHSLSTDAVTSLRQYIKETQKHFEHQEKPENPDYVTHISTSGKVLNRLDAFLNLGNSESLQLEDMSEDEQKTFLSMLSSLLKKGVMGYEMLEIENGQPEKYFMVNQLGSEETYNARLSDRDYSE